jgi:hypothetical protein
MEFSSYHLPYSHRTRFQVIRSTTKLVTKPKITSQFKLIRNGTNFVRTKSVEKPSNTVAKSIGNKYKWIRTSLKRTENQRLVRMICNASYLK